LFVINYIFKDANYIYEGETPIILIRVHNHYDILYSSRNEDLYYAKLWSEKRIYKTNDIKTFKEIGVEGVDSDNWYAIFTNKNTPPATIALLSAAIKRTLETESVKQRLLNSGTLPASSTPQELGALLKKDSEKWARLIREKNITAD
jgi:tripartite-type tricarboxylate transporter receptor subunit TctC